MPENNPNTSSVNEKPGTQKLDSGAISSTPIDLTKTPANQKPQVTPIITTEFLKGTETAEKDALYSDLFQTNADGEISRKQQTRRSYLEIFTNVMGFVVPVVVVLAIVMAVHVFIRSRQDNSFAENYPFLCGYLNYDIKANKEDKACKTAGIIENDFKLKTASLEKNIVNQLALYIPIKVASSSGASTKETSFIKDTYNSKVNYNDILSQFERIKANSQSVEGNNIMCKSVTIVGGNTLSTQCDIFGSDIGNVDSSGRSLGSSRSEAARFIEKLAKTQDSHFILENPPTVLSVESTENIKDVPTHFKTKTTITLSLKYIPFQPQI